MKRLTPYEVAVKKFGGVRKLALALGFDNHNKVLRWKDRGLIPAQHQQAVYKAGQSLGKPITLREIVFGAIVECPESKKDDCTTTQKAA